MKTPPSHSKEHKIRISNFYVFWPVRWFGQTAKISVHRAELEWETKKNVEKKNFYMTPHIMLMKLIHESQLSVFGHSLIENENLRFSLTPGTSHGEEIVKKNFEKFSQTKDVNSNIRYVRADRRDNNALSSNEPSSQTRAKISTTESTTNPFPSLLNWTQLAW